MLRPVLRFLLTLAAAVALQVVGMRITPGFVRWVDPFLAITIYVSLAVPGPPALVAGSATGLARDVLSGAAYGLHGFANTAVAYVAARLQMRLVVQDPLRSALLFALCAAVQQVILALLIFFTQPQMAVPRAADALALTLTTALLGGGAVALVARIRRWREETQAARRKRLRLE
ncbi:MAG: rod shape-determining protein MreD [Acidobacteriota bacterium]